MRVNTGESQATFSAHRGPQAEFATEDEAHACLRQALLAAGCGCGEHDLTLTVTGENWEGTYGPTPPEDDIDPHDYLRRAEPAKGPG